MLISLLIHYKSLNLLDLFAYLSYFFNLNTKEPKFIRNRLSEYGVTQVTTTEKPYIKKNFKQLIKKQR